MVIFKHTTRLTLAVIASYLLFTPIASAQKLLTGVAVFHAENHHSMTDCREGALQMARINALADEYGRTIGSGTISVSGTGKNGEQDFFQELATTEVCGEWIADVGEPKYDISLGPDNLYIVKCTVSGKTRPLSNEAPDFKAEVLRNGDTDKFIDTRFNSGDLMKLIFKAPCDGYVAVYLACADRTVYTLFPYINNSDGPIKIKGGKEYLLFSPTCTDLGEVDEMQLRTDVPMELNHLYIVFSPNEFSRAIDSASDNDAPRSLSFKEFSKWMMSNRSHDPKMGLKTIPITIIGPKN